MRVTELYRIILVDGMGRLLKGNGFYTSKREAMAEYFNIKKETEEKLKEIHEWEDKLDDKILDDLEICLEIINLNWLEKNAEMDMAVGSNTLTLSKKNDTTGKIEEIENIDFV